MRISFKSYYVVWKRRSWIWNTMSLSVFKSYYVVWKQEDEENKKDKQTKFKSYYVVWKLRNISKLFLKKVV